MAWDARILFLGLAPLLLLTTCTCSELQQGEPWEQAPLQALHKAGSKAHRPSAKTCEELYFDRQYIDHFNSKTRPEFWSQRYLLNDTYWRQKGRHQGPIFFYG